jgi:hypothetical protein
MRAKSLFALSHIFIVAVSWYLLPSSLHQSWVWQYQIPWPKVQQFPFH